MNRSIVPQTIFAMPTLLSAFTIWLACCGSLLAGPLLPELTAGWARATPPGARNAAAYLTLHNKGTSTLQLTGVQCAASLAARCEVHEHILRDGKMRMQRVTAPLDLPAGGNLRFTPGGYHVMLLDLAKPLVAGATVELVFTFADQGNYHVQLPVKPVSEE